jgi:ketosteroid isomerase-like protein
MKRRGLAVMLMWFLVPVTAVAGDLLKDEAAVDAVLSSLHQAASDADGELYFRLFADDAVFMGTDASERWSVAEFKAFAEPYFSQGRGWTYEKKERNIFVSSNGQTAWFDEMLWNQTYGTCRGTGVLVLTDGVWRIAQYNLTIPIPNDLAGGFAEKIKEYESGGSASQ